MPKSSKKSPVSKKSSSSNNEARQHFFSSEFQKKLTQGTGKVDGLGKYKPRVVESLYDPKTLHLTDEQAREHITQLKLQHPEYETEEEINLFKPACLTGMLRAIRIMGGYHGYTDKRERQEAINIVFEYLKLVTSPKSQWPRLLGSWGLSPTGRAETNPDEFMNFQKVDISPNFRTLLVGVKKSDLEGEAELEEGEAELEEGAAELEEGKNEKCGEVIEQLNKTQSISHSLVADRGKKVLVQDAEVARQIVSFEVEKIKEFNFGVSTIDGIPVLQYMNYRRETDKDGNVVWKKGYIDLNVSNRTFTIKYRPCSAVLAHTDAQALNINLLKVSLAIVARLSGIPLEKISECITSSNYLSGLITTSDSNSQHYVVHIPDDKVSSFATQELFTRGLSCDSFYNLSDFRIREYTARVFVWLYLEATLLSKLEESSSSGNFQEDALKKQKIKGFLKELKYNDRRRTNNLIYLGLYEPLTGTKGDESFFILVELANIRLEQNCPTELRKLLDELSFKKKRAPRQPTMRPFEVSLSVPMKLRELLDSDKLVSTTPEINTLVREVIMGGINQIEKLLKKSKKKLPIRDIVSLFSKSAPFRFPEDLSPNVKYNLRLLMKTLTDTMLEELNKNREHLFHQSPWGPPNGTVKWKVSPLSSLYQHYDPSLHTHRFSQSNRSRKSMDWLRGLQLKNSPALQENRPALQENRPASLNATALQENRPASLNATALPNAPALQENSEIKKVKLAIAIKIPDSLENIKKIMRKVAIYYYVLYRPVKPPIEVTRLVYGRINIILKQLSFALDELNNSSNNNANFEYSKHLNRALTHANKLLELATSPELELLFRDIYEIVSSTPDTSASTGNFESIYAKPNSGNGSSLGALTRRASITPDIKTGAGRTAGQTSLTAIYGTDNMLVQSVNESPVAPPKKRESQKAEPPKKVAKKSKPATQKNTPQ